MRHVRAEDNSGHQELLRISVLHSDLIVEPPPVHGQSCGPSYLIHLSSPRHNLFMVALKGISAFSRGRRCGLQAGPAQHAARLCR